MVSQAGSLGSRAVLCPCVRPYHVSASLAAAGHHRSAFSGSSFPVKQASPQVCHSLARGYLVRQRHGRQRLFRWTHRRSRLPRAEVQDLFRQFFIGLDEAPINDGEFSSSMHQECTSMVRLE
eukprot:8914076-Lingulodinium_polyedra.AAC.1